MARAVWKNTVIAESDDVVTVDGAVYFPWDSLNWDHLEASAHRTRCFLKGTASYFDLVVDEDVNPDAAFWYPDPSEAASMIEGRVAFWRGVRVEGSTDTSRAGRVVQRFLGPLAKRR